MSASDALPDEAPRPDTGLLAAFAHRVATRDLPPERPPHGYDQASLEICIALALRERLPGLDPRRSFTFGRVCYALMAHPRLTTKDLAELADTTRLTLHRALPVLVEAGLLLSQRTGGRHYHLLSRDGEDWLLEVTK